MKNRIIETNESLETVHTGNLENNKEDAITLVALVITILFSYDEK